MGQWEASAGASDEWYTPPYIFEALGETFDMDVAAPMLLPSWIGDRLNPTSPQGGRRWLWKDSLETDWAGFVWMNPPFGGRNSLAPWLKQFFDHGNGIALTPDRTSALWFRDAWERADLALFMPKVRFIRPDGSVGKQPANGTCLWASGNRAINALERAASVGLGILAQPRKVAA
ncbi:phage N-6-adenine-methyltransferase [Sphingobium sp. CFD-1]|uniref:phage N-6-adenine-methyltransferase n=1 Tax=Sphingobium sp. CFD-1 TaxID=2878545 RepID=UPI00214B9EBF|nr:phage N-6-adenine-methyltransferase [Sphingobium sp. CFD-1]